MKNKFDWGYLAVKLTSRKLWMTLAGFVSMLMVANGSGEESASRVVALIMAGASVLAYVIGEGLADRGEEEDENIVQLPEGYILLPEKIVNVETEWIEEADDYYESKETVNTKETFIAEEPKQKNS